LSGIVDQPERKGTTLRKPQYPAKHLSGDDFVTAFGQKPLPGIPIGSHWKLPCSTMKLLLSIALQRADIDFQGEQPTFRIATIRL
jgi:hypothetical protein